MGARKGLVFVDSGPFVLDLAFPQDPRTPLTRKFLEQVRASGRGITGLSNVLEVAGAVSFHLSHRRIEALVRQFSALYGLRVWPKDGPLVPVVSDVVDRIGRRMALGDALALCSAETSTPSVGTFVTWDPTDFEGRTNLAVRTPQQFLRGA